MEDYQERVVQEKVELDWKKGRLDTFLRSGGHFEVGDEEYNRMVRQITAMREYSQALGERIAAFK